MPKNPKADDARVTAVQIAWKFFLHGYKTQESALRALRRRVPQLNSASALNLLNRGLELQTLAIKLIEPHLPSLGPIFYSQGQLAESDLTDLSRQLSAHFPDWPPSAIHIALWSAAIFHLK